MAATMCLFPSMLANVAKPGIISAMQPDGTTVNIRLSGNEFSNRAYSSDGYLLTVDANGFYVFALCGEDGLPTASSVRADNPETRSMTTKSFLMSINQKEVVDAFNRLETRKTEERDSSIAKRTAHRKAGAGRFDTSFPTAGDQHVLVILAEFADNEFSSTDNPNEYFTRMLNEEGFADNYATGSARDYFLENSSGTFRPQFDVYGPVKLEKDMAYYGQHMGSANDRRPEKLITDACSLLDDEIDFTLYDCDNDSVIDNVYVFYAGYGEAEGGGANTIWPHSAFITDISRKKYHFDELLLDRYACSNELLISGETVGIGTFVHEFSHVLGLPDIYSTNYGSSFTPAAWSCIDNGNYNNNGHTPPYYSAFERYSLGWMEPVVLSEPGEYELAAIHKSNEAFIIPTDREEEYFLFENRQQEGNDTYIPGHGMLVWHIDFDSDIWLINAANNDPAHQRVDLVEADNILTADTRAGDSFPGSEGITSFTDITTPALVDWNDTSFGIGLHDISESEDGVIRFTVRESGSTGMSVNHPGNDSLVKTEGNRVYATAYPADIYDITGRKTATIGHNPHTLAPGVYVAVCGKYRQKFLIR